MFFKPAIIALFTGSFLISGMLLFSAFYAGQILSKWDIKSGAETQLKLERSTYLVSSIMAYALAFQLFSFFLFVYTADNLHPFFTGAMCAAGSLNADKWGYPAILLKVLNFLLAGSWLILNFTDNRGYDYPLIKQKYTLLLWITPFILAETAIQAAYFLGLAPEVITSCCGTTFSAEAQSIAAEVVALPVPTMEAAFYSSVSVMGVLGVCFYRTGKGGYLFSAASSVTFFIAIAALISFVSIYIYELPTHHCPFCILQQEYGYIGYPLYLTLLGGALGGLGVGILMPFREIASLKEILPIIQKKLTLLSLTLYALFTALVIYKVIFSNLKM